MRFLADESVDRPIVDALRRAGYDVDYIAELAPGTADPEVLDQANRESSVLLTGDKGFGELVFRRRQQNRGVVLLRLSGLSQQRKAEIAIEVFGARAADFEGCFSVITETGVRSRRQG